MPCPYFIPTEPFQDAAFPHPARLPLGAAYRGSCGATEDGGGVLSDEQLKQCNLGYARDCSRLPQEREADAVRFSILRERDGQISICYVEELNYLPRASGNLHYESLTDCWSQMHSNQRIQTLAECFLQSYLARR
jgi:hypothetical protein